MAYPARGRYFDEFSEGETFTTTARTVTEGAVDLFAGLSGDFNPLHTDEEMARHTPTKGRVAHGMLVLAIATGQVNLRRRRYVGGSLEKASARRGWRRASR